MNTKPVLIVESPAKARTIAKYLGDAYQVLACLGHIKDLPVKELGVDVDHEFAITEKILPERVEFIKQLKKLARTSPEIVIATDPDREGEAIAAHIRIEVNRDDVTRVQFTEITKAGIAAGLAQTSLIDDHLVEARQTRRIIDRLVGYKVSRVLWSTLQKNMKSVQTTLSAGRVQSAALKMIVERERERGRFKSVTYHNLMADLLTSSGQTFPARLHKLDSQRLARGVDFDSTSGELTGSAVITLEKEAAEKLAVALKPGPWIISQVDSKPQISKPRPPFTTSTLQQEAVRKLRFPARKTMRHAQELYEAGYITYMRTDSTQLSSEALQAARREIAQRYGEEYLPPRPVHYKTPVKNAQEAHEAIRPAGSRFTTLEAVTRATSSEAGRLYELIWKRTLASQMLPARYQQTTVSITVQEAEFRAQGRVILFPGYRRVYVEGSDDPAAELAHQETALPQLQPGQELRCRDLKVEKHTTQPPARFSEASLVKELEARGIGRPSTFAAIIETILRRNYVSRSKGTLIPSYLGVAVTQLLENHFEPLVDSHFTAQMEDSLDAIARGELEPLPFMSHFYFGSEDQPGLVQMLATNIDIPRACTVDLPVEGDQPIQVRIGHYGPYLQQGQERKSLPATLALGDITIAKALEILAGDAEEPQVLGRDPESGQEVLLKNGPYGPYLQRGKTRKSIPKETSPEEVDLKMALTLLALPRRVGRDPATGQEILADYGRYGPYLKLGSRNRSLPASESPLEVTLKRALEVLNSGRAKSEPLRILGTDPATGTELTLKNGRYGPYISDGKINAALPKGTDPDQVTLEGARQLIEQKRAAGPRKKRRRKK